MRSLHAAIALLMLTNACGGDDGKDSGETGEAEDFGLVRGDLEITRIEVAQSIVQPVYADGEVVSPVAYSVPLIPDRTMWVRAWWDPPLEWTPRPLTARLHLEDEEGNEVSYDDEESLKGTPPFVQGKTTATDILSGFYWRLDPASVTPGMRYSVTVHEPEPVDIPASTGKTRWPRENNTAMAVNEAPSALNLYLVGIRYDIPGCSTDTSVLPPDELEAIRVGFESWTGVATNSVAIDTSLSVDIDSPTNVLALLDVVGSMRAEYADIPDAFFYIMLDDCSPVPDGILGVAPVNQHPPVLGDAASRYGAGLWNPNDVRESVNTAVHEIGHSQGALHAPCGGVDGADPEYPHANATLGSVGMDPFTGEFYAAAAFTDFMSYCRPYWVSDYRFFRSYVVQSTLTAWAGADLSDTLPLLPPSYTGETLNGVVQANGETRWWLNKNTRPAAARLDGELHLALRTSAGTRTLPIDVRALPDLPDAHLVQVPLVDGITLEDIEAIEVSGALSLTLEAPEIHDTRALQASMRR